MKYDEDGWRWYNNKPSITTILGNTVANPKLNNWYKKNSANKIEKVMVTTADMGTRAHKCFEDILLGNKPKYEDDIRHIVLSFIDWKEKNNVKPLHLEKTVESEKYGFAGTLDFCGYINGKLVIADWKTSNNYKITNGWQMGAQRLAALEALGLNPECGLLGVQISRDKGEVKTFEYTHIQSVEDAFLRTLDTFKMLYWNKLSKLEWPWLMQQATIRKG